MDYHSIDPTTEQLVAGFDTLSDTAVESRLTEAWSAFEMWRTTPPSRRADLLDAAAAGLEKRAEELARLMADEMGKPLAQGLAEARKCAVGCRYYADEGPELLAPRTRPSDGTSSCVRYDPLGPLLAVMPWNFPFWQFFRFAAPALLAGNAVLLKHAPNTPRCALAIETLLHEVGFPVGVVQNLFVTHEQVARIIADDRVRGVTLTGSTRAGRELGSIAGRHLRPTVLELGGSDPFLVFADAELERAATVGVEARCQNNGQSCIAAKRFLVERPVYEEFLGAFVAAMRSRVVGDPRDPGTDLGPLARADLRDTLVAQVARTVEAGGRVRCGAERPVGRGFFYPATVVTDVPANAPAATEELFGPVATVTPFRDEAEALDLANGTDYGLGASLWTRDESRVERLVPRIEAGSVFVNGLVKSDPRLPFGGVKASGFGRELGAEGALQFVNTKTVWIA